MSLLTLQNPAVLETDPVRALFARAFAKEQLADPDETRAWLAKNLPSDTLGVFLWGDFSNGFSGLAIVAQGNGPLAPEVMVLHFYSRANMQAREGLMRAIETWAQQREAKQLWSLNQSGHSDEAFIKLMSELSGGGQGRVRCSVIEYQLE